MNRQPKLPVRAENAPICNHTGPAPGYRERTQQDSRNNNNTSSSTNGAAASGLAQGLCRFFFGGRAGSLSGVLYALRRVEPPLRLFFAKFCSFLGNAGACLSHHGRLLPTAAHVMAVADAVAHVVAATHFRTIG